MCFEITYLDNGRKGMGPIKRKAELMNTAPIKMPIFGGISRSYRWPHIGEVRRLVNPPVIKNRPNMAGVK